MHGARSARRDGEFRGKKVRSGFPTSQKVTPGSGGRVETRRPARTSSDRGVEVEGHARGRRRRSLVGRAPVNGVSTPILGGRSLFRAMLTRLRFPATSVSRKRRRTVLTRAARQCESRSARNFKPGTPPHHRLFTKSGVIRSWRPPPARGHTRPRSRWHPPLRKMIRSSRWSSAASSVRVSATFVRTLEVRLGHTSHPIFLAVRSSPALARADELAPLLTRPVVSPLAPQRGRISSSIPRAKRSPRPSLDPTSSSPKVRAAPRANPITRVATPRTTDYPLRPVFSNLALGDVRPRASPSLETETNPLPIPRALTHPLTPPPRSFRRPQSSAPASSTRTPSPTSRSSIPRWRWRSASAPAAPPRTTPASFAVGSAASSSTDGTPSRRLWTTPDRSVGKSSEAKCRPSSRRRPRAPSCANPASRRIPPSIERPRVPRVPRVPARRSRRTTRFFFSRS